MPVQAGGQGQGRGRSINSIPHVAATLSAGSHPGSAIPERHHEDDENLVVGIEGEDTARALLSRATVYRMDLDTETFVVADPISANEGKTYTHEGEHNFRLNNVIQGDTLAMPDAVAFKPSHYTRDKDGAPSDIYPPLSADADKRDQDPLILTGGNDASAPEADPHPLVRALRKAVGEEAFAEWRSRVLDPLQPAKALRPEVYGGYLRRPSDKVGSGLDDRTLACPESVPAGSLRDLWEGANGSPPQRQELAEQLARELGEAVPRGPHEGSPMGVRRLTPLETERLQGFPDGWTEFGADGNPIADSHRYRLMGNAVATVCAQWLGHRLVAVDAMMRAQEEVSDARTSG